MTDYPKANVLVNHVEPCPRRIRAYVGPTAVFDTTRALYVWEWPAFPQYYIPRDDLTEGVLVDEEETFETGQGVLRRYGLQVGSTIRQGAARVVIEPAIDELHGMVRFEWRSMDAWFEEDERVHVHPRNPYARVDCIHSTRSVRVELDGVVLAETSSPVMLFETSLPTRYYINRTDVRLEHLQPSDTVTSCPYKGTTSAYWSARVGEKVVKDIAWAYDFPTREVFPIAGMVAFYNEKVDIVLGGTRLERPVTTFS